MRRLIDRERLLRFMRELGRAARGEARVYLAGGSSAVLLEWRPTTIDIDLEIRPESDDVLRAIPRLKEELEVNVELASPGHFIPELPGWESRSPFIGREGPLWFHHYDFYAQALAKIERSHTRDLLDVRAIHELGLVEPGRLMELFASIEPQLYRYPAIDPRSFRTAVEETVAELGRSEN
ncbi:MAG TPA: hypothetical protein VNA04_09935 [Thermoanaerobaculia bacterium]|nr:hypothetical protein [Thermoanaerobaculia bacterium]